MPGIFLPQVSALRHSQLSSATLSDLLGFGNTAPLVTESNVPLGSVLVPKRSRLQEEALLSFKFFSCIPQCPTESTRNRDLDRLLSVCLDTRTRDGSGADKSVPRKRAARHRGRVKAFPKVCRVLFGRVVLEMVYGQEEENGTGRRR